MGFKDILKKLKLGDINGLKVVVDLSRNIEVKDCTFVVDSNLSGKREYTLPNTVKYDEVIGHVDDLYKKDVSGFVREDLVLPEVCMLVTREKRKKIFKHYKNTIKEEHYRALITAYTIMEFEDNGDYKSASDLFDKYVNRFPHCSRHIYNFCRSGLMEGKFWNELGSIIVQGASDPVIYDTFSKKFDEYVNFYSDAIWISTQMSFKDVAREIRIRINDDKQIRLDIYLRGQDKIDLFEEDVVQLIDLKKGLSTEEISKYQIGITPCIRITIVKDVRVFKIF